MTTISRVLHRRGQGSTGEDYSEVTITGSDTAGQKEAWIKVEAAYKRFGGVNSYSTSTAGTRLNREEFLQAIAETLNVTIVENSELPRVARNGYGDLDARFPSGSKYEDWVFSESDMRQIPSDSGVLAHVALAKFLRENPPQDPQVEALARKLAEDRESTTGVSWPHYTDEARRLIAIGVRVEEPK